MKKFVFKIFMALLPMVIYVACFVMCEPYNYFGIHERALCDWTPLQVIREYMRNPSENIIIGDSRMNHYDLEYAEELSGKKWANLSTGGQSSNQTYELYVWANSQVGVENVIMDMSFWQIMESPGSPSVIPAIYIAEHPLDYMVTRDYVIEAFSQLNVQAAEKLETQPVNEAKYREDLINYATQYIYPGCIDYRIGEDQLQHYLYVINDVQARGGQAKILAPVVQESIWTYVIEPLQLEPYLEEYKEEVSKYAVVYDMEWKSDLAKEQDCFADGFHFSNWRYYNEIYLQNLLSDGNKYVIIRDNTDN